MKLKNIWLCSAIAALFACGSNDDPIEPPIVKPDPPVVEKTVTIAGVLNENTESKNSFAAENVSTDGLKNTWAAGDAVATCVSGSEKLGSFSVAQADDKSHNATLTGELGSKPTVTSTVYACLKTTTATINGANLTFSFAQQTGKAADLGKHDVLTASGKYALETESPIAMTFEHKMAFLKLTLTSPVTNTATSAKITLKGDGLANSVKWNGNNGSISNNTGEINISDAEISGKNITAYVAVLAGNSPSKLTAEVDINGNKQTFNIDNAPTSLSPGRLYTINKENAIESFSKTYWVNDDAQSIELDYPYYIIESIEHIPTEESDWLSASSDGNKVTITTTANTTGAPRQAIMTIRCGETMSTVDLTQISDKDFAGNWNMTAFKLFTSEGSAESGTYDEGWGYSSTVPPTSESTQAIEDGYDYGNKTEITIANKKGSTATACDGLINKNTPSNHTNNLLMTGLYENLQTEAWSNVNYNDKSATIGLFIDTRESTKTQRIFSGCYAGQYMGLMPELRDKNGNWKLAYATIGSPNMWWYMGKVKVVGHTTTVTWYGNSSDHQNLSTSPNNDVWGLQVFRYTTPRFNASTLIRQGGSGTNGAYAVTYQGDIVMKRTATGYKEIETEGENK